MIVISSGDRLWCLGDEVVSHRRYEYYFHQNSPFDCFPRAGDRLHCFYHPLHHHLEVGEGCQWWCTVPLVALQQGEACLGVVDEVKPHYSSPHHR